MVEYGPKIIGDILIWTIGSWLVKKIAGTVECLMEKKSTILACKNSYLI